MNEEEYKKLLKEGQILKFKYNEHDFGESNKNEIDTISAIIMTGIAALSPFFGIFLLVYMLVTFMTI